MQPSFHVSAKIRIFHHRTTYSRLDKVKVRKYDHKNENWQTFFSKLKAFERLFSSSVWARTELEVQNNSAQTSNIWSCSDIEVLDINIKQTIRISNYKEAISVKAKGDNKAKHKKPSLM